MHYEGVWVARSVYGAESKWTRLPGRVRTSQVVVMVITRKVRESRCVTSGGSFPRDSSWTADSSASPSKRYRPLLFSNHVSSNFCGLSTLQLCRIIAISGSTDGLQVMCYSCVSPSDCNVFLRETDNQNKLVLSELSYCNMRACIPLMLPLAARNATPVY